MYFDNTIFYVQNVLQLLCFRLSGGLFAFIFNLFLSLHVITPPAAAAAVSIL